MVADGPPGEIPQIGSVPWRKRPESLSARANSTSGTCLSALANDESIFVHSRRRSELTVCTCAWDCIPSRKIGTFRVNPPDRGRIPGGGGGGAISFPASRVAKQRMRAAAGHSSPLHLAMDGTCGDPLALTRSSEVMRGRKQGEMPVRCRGRAAVNLLEADCACAYQSFWGRHWGANSPIGMAQLAKILRWQGGAACCR